MAKHRTSTRTTARKVALGAMAAVGLSGSLVLGHATGTTAMVQLANTVIGIGGRSDPTSAHVAAKLAGTVIPKVGNYGYFGVHYPATVALDSSRDVAIPIIHEYLTNTGKDEDHLIVAGYSLGTMAAEQEKRNLQLLGESAPTHEQLTFVMIASPFGGNGGIFGRLPGVGIPFVTTGMGPAQPSRYDTTYSANMYDLYADFPAYFNPVSLLNSALSIRYGHPDGFYDAIDPAASYAYETTVHHQETASTDTYLLYYNPHLPLLGPLRELAAMTKTSNFAEPLISSVEPLLRVLVDMGYTDRVNAKPAELTPFSFMTPTAKIVQALAAIPGALAQGAANLASGGHATVTPPNPDGNLIPKPTVPSPKPQLQDSPARITPTQDVPKPELDEKPVKPVPAVAKLAATTDDDDDRHSTVTSDGNKFTPGSVASATTGTTGDTVTPTPTVTSDAASTPAAQQPSADTDTGSDAAA